MQEISMRTFESPADFAGVLWDFFSGPTFFMTFRKMDPVFREKLILAFSSTNNCGLCMRVHTAWAMALGLKKEDVEKLARLTKSDFPEKEWLAFNYARKFAVQRGREPKGPEVFAYNTAYSKTERAYMKKILRMMRMANYSANFFLGLPYRADLEPGRDFSRTGLLKRLPLSLKHLPSLIEKKLGTGAPA